MIMPEDFPIRLTARMLKTIGGTQFYYDGGGKRLKALRDGVTTRYIYDAGGTLLGRGGRKQQYHPLLYLWQWIARDGNTGRSDLLLPLQRRLQHGGDDRFITKYCQ